MLTALAEGVVVFYYYDYNNYYYYTTTTTRHLGVILRVTETTMDLQSIQSCV